MLEGGRSPTAALQPRPSCAIIGRRRTRTCTCIWLGPLPPIGQGTRGAQSPPSPEVDHQQATHHTLPSPVLLSFPFPSVLRPQLFISQAHQLFFPLPAIDFFIPRQTRPRYPCRLVLSLLHHLLFFEPATSVSIHSIQGASLPRLSPSYHLEQLPSATLSLVPLSPVVCPLPAQRINSHPIRKKFLTDCLTPDYPGFHLYHTLILHPRYVE